MTARVNSDEADVDERNALLAKRHGGGGLTPEESARLTILTERLRGRTPRVDEAEVQALEDVKRELDEIGKTVAELEARYGR